MWDLVGNTEDRFSHNEAQKEISIHAVVISHEAGNVTYYFIFHLKVCFSSEKFRSENMVNNVCSLREIRTFG